MLCPYAVRFILSSFNLFLSKLMGDPLHNLNELHTTMQHTAELHTTRWLGCVQVAQTTM